MCGKDSQCRGKQQTQIGLSSAVSPSASTSHEISLVLAIPSTPSGDVRGLLTGPTRPPPLGVDKPSGCIRPDIKRADTR
ncbi:hypothetical protein PCANC_24395 [Puccinia coronata f. sp. avenae]|uniref:Uncharacterized protein n=1 Tax=Puccinia coronata f. sp. avenae TaxID=200324 RepID=A0A2N5TYN5_9BASI|nr:hypothetical protein PCANC_24395 [Puccinia coronata f. sp. avenae]